jgi:hypothetical protein
MPRILASTSPAAGHLFPLTPILDKLADRGHQVSVRTLAAQVPLSTAAKTGSWPQCQGQRRRPAFPSLRLLPDVCRSRGPCMGMHSSSCGGCLPRLGVSALTGVTARLVASGKAAARSATRKGPAGSAGPIRRLVQCRNLPFRSDMTAVRYLLAVATSGGLFIAAGSPARRDDYKAGSFGWGSR